MELRLDIEGAKPEEIARGIDAAQVVFDREGIAAEVAASGMFALQVWGIKGFHNATSRARAKRLRPMSG